MSFPYHTGFLALDRFVGPSHAGSVVGDADRAYTNRRTNMPMLPLRVTASILILVALLTFSGLAIAADSRTDLPQRAINRSQITLPGSRPFVLRAKVVEITNPANTNYNAEIEEYWVAPDKWRRVVKTSSFSETLIVDGGKTDELITGDYFPNWLRTVVAAIFDPGSAIKEGFGSSSPTGMSEKLCQRFTFMAGIAPVSNKVFSAFCLDDGLIDFVAKPGYTAIYKNYKNFAGKQVARTVAEDIESGTVLEATIEELKELKSPDETMFAIQDASAPLQTIRADEPTLRSLAVNAPDIVWPASHGGAAAGTLSLYVCVDRTGHVREIYELNSSNPGLSDVARDQVMKWEFKPAVTHGVPVQVESILTFAFNSATAK
jgi:TonB-like protein